MPCKCNPAAQRSSILGYLILELRGDFSIFSLWVALASRLDYRTVACRKPYQLTTTPNLGDPRESDRQQQSQDAQREAVNALPRLPYFSSTNFVIRATAHDPRSPTHEVF